LLVARGNWALVLNSPRASNGPLVHCSTGQRAQSLCPSLRQPFGRLRAIIWPPLGSFQVGKNFAPRLEADEWQRRHNNKDVVISQARRGARWRELSARQGGHNVARGSSSEETLHFGAQIRLLALRLHSERQSYARRSSCLLGGVDGIPLFTSG